MNKMLQKYKDLPVQARAAFWFALCSAIQSGASFLAIPFFTRLMSQEPIWNRYALQLLASDCDYLCHVEYLLCRFQ